MSAGKIYTIGYRNQGDEALALLDVMLAERVPDEFKPKPQVIKRRGELLFTHMLIDVRMSSRAPVDGRFNGAALSMRFRACYQHIPAFGNKNYRVDDQEKGIEIRNLAAGFAGVQLYLPTHSLILLCACADYHTCHRLVVAQYLVEQVPSLVVEHLLVPKSPFKQESLF